MCFCYLFNSSFIRVIIASASLINKLKPIFKRWPILLGFIFLFENSMHQLRKKSLSNKELINIMNKVFFINPKLAIILKNKILLFFFLFIGFFANAQVNLDSLRSIWQDTSQADTVRLDAILFLCLNYAWIMLESIQTLQWCWVLKCSILQKQRD